MFWLVGLDLVFLVGRNFIIFTGSLPRTVANEMLSMHLSSKIEPPK